MLLNLIVYVPLSNLSNTLWIVAVALSLRSGYRIEFISLQISLARPPHHLPPPPPLATKKSTGIYVGDYV